MTNSDCFYTLMAGKNARKFLMPYLPIAINGHKQKLITNRHD